VEPSQAEIGFGQHWCLITKIT